VELLDKYGDSDEAEAKIAKEMGWDHSEDESEDDRMGIEEINAICDAAANGPPPEPDPNRTALTGLQRGGDLRHRCNIAVSRAR